MQHELDLKTAIYRGRVLQAITDAISNGASTLTSICRHCHGAFPPIVRDLIAHTMVGHASIPHRAWLDEDPGMYDSALPAMPEPHPVDYEWRYTAGTADSLAEYLMQSGKRICCFGTPTVFWRLRHHGADATLFDRNDGLVQYLRPEDRAQIHLQDLLRSDSGMQFKSGGNTKYDVVLLDPPWYVDHMVIWIAKALQFLRPGGHLVLTLFPGLIRPTAVDERAQIMSVLESLGRVTFLPFSALYTTPLFEHETLGAFGLGDLGQWRSADLVSVAVQNPMFPLPHGETHEERWVKVQLGTQVVAVRQGIVTADDRRGLRFEAPESDGSFLLKSVSARDPVRKSVGVWTSRNRALVATQGGSEVLPFLERLAAGDAPSRALNAASPQSQHSLRLLLALIGW